MSKVFDIDFKRLIVLLLPTFMRKPIIFAFLKALIRPVIVLYDEFKSQRVKNMYKANHNSQVCYMRAMLNDSFDSDQRRIYIAEGASDDWTFVYKKETFNESDGGEALMISTADSITYDSLGNATLTFNSDNDGVHLISKQGSIGSNGLDFLVMVPEGLKGMIDENKMTALVNYYKLASKRYAITYF